MKLIEPSAEILEQSSGLDGIYKQIEIAGRTCYKSEENVTEDSAKGFVDRMIKSGHGAMLEHGTVYLHLSATSRKCFESNIVKKYEENKYSKVQEKFEDIETDYRDWYVTTNYRVLVENNWLDDLQYLCEPTEYHEKRITVKFICDRGISHELVRHRVFSFAQESTRYCNYSKDKFGNELTFIRPSTLEDKETYSYNRFYGTLELFENEYLILLEKGWKPQEARAILPNALKTEIVMTGFESDWENFFKLRCDKAAHPDMQVLANKLKGLMNEEK